MENINEFEEWLHKLLKDAKTKFCMTDKTMAYILLREGTNYYLKQLVNDELRNTSKHN